MGLFEKFNWYVNRLKAMDAQEISGHLKKKSVAFKDNFGLPDWSKVNPFDEKGASFPSLKPRKDFPEDLLEEIKWETWDLYKGNWKAFGWCEIKVDDPPMWDKDYLVNKQFPTSKPGNKLNHRHLPEGADIKLVWELSRWYTLVRLAQGAYLLQDIRLAEVVLRWMQSWHRENPPFKGWNWTSALESGMRLIQLTWLDKLLSQLDWEDDELKESFTQSWTSLLSEILGPHIYYTWNYRSFGSSANNHLLGELSGIIIATVRWPALSRYTFSLSQLKSLWENEVISQFAEDGGNREQALNYQLYAFEFCWQTRMALKESGLPVRADVEDRLRAAAMFYRNLQVPEDPWDYGDSDSAVVTPFVTDSSRYIKEWCDWLKVPGENQSLYFWLGAPPEKPQKKCGEFVGGHWLSYANSGYAISRKEDWTIRWDMSPLGYKSIAAHGHLDALHVSLWFKGIAFIIDPGTGAYYGDTKLRKHLASRSVHNGPDVPSIPFGNRLGPFMWNNHHSDPSTRLKGENALLGQITTPDGEISRFIKPIEHKNGNGWSITDSVKGSHAESRVPFSVTWQCAPGTEIDEQSPTSWILSRSGQKILMEVQSQWEKSEVRIPNKSSSEYRWGDTPPLGICSSAFRKVASGPVIIVHGHGSESCQFETTFISLNEP